MVTYTVEAVEEPALVGNGQEAVRLKLSFFDRRKKRAAKWTHTGAMNPLTLDEKSNTTQLAWTPQAWDEFWEVYRQAKPYSIPPPQASSRPPPDGIYVVEKVRQVLHLPVWVRCRGCRVLQRVCARTRMCGHVLPCLVHPPFLVRDSRYSRSSTNTFPCLEEHNRHPIHLHECLKHIVAKLRARSASLVPPWCPQVLGFEPVDATFSVRRLQAVLCCIHIVSK